MVIGAEKFQILAGPEKSEDRSVLSTPKNPVREIVGK
jgi:hypothetical protein